jgi:hypothetical protein
MMLRRMTRLWRVSRAGLRWLTLWDEARALPVTYQSPEWWQKFLQATRDAALVVGMPEVIDMMLKKNWKTSLAGVSTILAIVAKVIASGQVDWQTDGPAILTAIGLLVAKDAPPKE